LSSSIIKNKNIIKSKKTIDIILISFLTEKSDFFVSALKRYLKKLSNWYGTKLKIKITTATTIKNCQKLLAAEIVILYIATTRSG